MVNEQELTETRTLVSAKCYGTYPQYPRALVGGWTQQTAVTDDVMDLARWTTSQLSGYTGIQGDHSVIVDDTLLKPRPVAVKLVTITNSPCVLMTFVCMAIISIPLSNS